MYISGFTFVRNACKYDYPVVESINSLLPLVDELIVCLGKSEDETEALIHSIKTDKIKIVNSIWDDTLREGGKVLASETNKAFDAINSKSDWAIYLQADEVIHEEDFDTIRREMEAELNNKKVEGLLLKYVHFYGDYKYVGNSRRWYRNEIRIIRNNKKIRSYKDAQGFRIDGRKLQVKSIDARIFHYGWVKNPYHQLEKIKNFQLLWHSEEEVKRKVEDVPYDYGVIDSLKLFEGTHPLVMTTKIEKVNWEFTFDVSKSNLKFKERILNLFESITGHRLFEYKNYNLIKK